MASPHRRVLRLEIMAIHRSATSLPWIPKSFVPWKQGTCLQLLLRFKMMMFVSVKQIKLQWLHLKVFVSLYLFLFFLLFFLCVGVRERTLWTNEQHFSIFTNKCRQFLLVGATVFLLFYNSFYWDLLAP